MTIPYLIELIPADLAEKAVSVEQTGQSDYWNLQTFEMVFRFNDEYDMVVKFNCDADYGDDAAMAVLENASYAAHLVRQINQTGSGPLPFVSEFIGDFGCVIGRSAVTGEPDLSQLEKDNMVWKLRKDLSAAERGWFVEPLDKCVRLFLSGVPQPETKRFSVCVPYNCPPRRYLSIIGNLPLLQHLMESLEWPQEFALGLVEHK